MSSRTIVFAIVVALFSSEAIASTVTIESSDSGIKAVTPLEISETDYPIEALLANQEGKVTLEFSLDGAGHATNLRLISSSGAPLLDQKAAQLVGTRWVFQPTAVTGRLSIDWKLPLEGAGDYSVAVPPHPAGAVEPKPTASHAVTADDYPPLSIRFKEQGLVALRYLIRPDGSTGDVQIV